MMYVRTFLHPPYSLSGRIYSFLLGLSCCVIYAIFFWKLRNFVIARNLKTFVMYVSSSRIWNMMKDTLSILFPMFSSSDIWYDFNEILIKDNNSEANGNERKTRRCSSLLWSLFHFRGCSKNLEKYSNTILEASLDIFFKKTTEITQN